MNEKLHLLTLVADMKRRRLNLVEMCAELETHGISKTPSSLSRWWGRQIKAGRKLKAELEAVETLMRIEKGRSIPAQRQKQKLKTTEQGNAWSTLAQADKSQLLD